MATALGRYYDELVRAQLPEPLAHEIVLDAARRLHVGDLQPHFDLADLR
jgi:hypothetical protein